MESSRLEVRTSNDVLDDQLECYLECIDSCVSVPKSPPKGKNTFSDYSSSAQDRLACQYIAASDVSLFGHGRIQRGQLRDLIQNHILFSNTEKKKDRTKRDKKQQYKGYHSHSNRYESKHAGDKDSKSSSSSFGGSTESKQYGTTEIGTLCLLVVKAIAEGSCTSFLIAIAALLDFETSAPNAATAMMPIGHIIAALFASPSNANSEVGTSSSQRQRDEDVGSPFSVFLYSYFQSQRQESDREEREDRERERARERARELEQRRDAKESKQTRKDKTKQAVTPATAPPESTPAGRFGIGSIEEDYILEEMDEEEMLAQALALSMESAAETNNAETAPLDSDAMDVEEFHDDEPTDQNNDVAEDTVNSDDDPAENFDTSPSDNEDIVHNRPTAYDTVHPFCSFGPSRILGFWDSFHFQDPRTLEECLISVRNVCVALFMCLGFAADRCANEKSVVVEDNETQGCRIQCNLAVPMWLFPSQLNFELIEHLLQVLTERNQIAVGGADNFTDASDGFSSVKNSYFSVWASRMTLQLLRGFFYVTVQSSERLYALGMESNLPYHSIRLNQSKHSLPLVVSLLLIVTRIMGKESLQRTPADFLSRWVPNFSTTRCIYEFRILAQRTFVAGFPVFIPLAADRDGLLQQMLQQNCIVENELLEQLCTRNSVYDSNFGTLVHIPENFYVFQLLQHICASPSILEYPQRYFVSRLESSPYDDLGCRALFAKLLAFQPRNKEMAVERALLDRMMLLKPSQRRWVGWGELILLRSIQMEYAKLFKLVVSDSSVSRPSTSISRLAFSPMNCSNHISLNASNSTATLKSTRSGWNTVLLDSDAGFPPRTGSYEWDIVIDRCDRGDLYIGLATGRAYLTSFIGNDSFSFGLMGSKTLLHKHTKANNVFAFGFRTHDVVHLKLDTNARCLYARVNTTSEWSAVFESLPAVHLFGAVSLKNNGDAVSVAPTANRTSVDLETDSIANGTGVTTLESRESSLLYGSMQSSLASVKHFLGHVQYCLSLADSLLSDNKSTQDIRNHHPLISVCVPSLAASIAELMVSADLGATLAVHLLPSLSVFAKRLSERTSAAGGLNSGNNSAASTHTDVFRTNIMGTWTIKCSQLSSSVPGQEYCVVLDSDLSESLDTSEQPIFAFGGRGESTALGLAISGVTCGLHVSFVEYWALGSKCSFDGKLSLCGCSMNGTFTEEKSGKSGTFTAVRTSIAFDKSFEEMHHGVVLKTGAVVSTLVGKLAGYLISGPSTFRDSLQLEPIPTLLDADQDSALSEEGEDNDSVASDKTPVPIQSPDEETKKWCQSELFSNGSPLKGQLCQSVADEIKFHSKFFSNDWQGDFDSGITPADLLYGSNTHTGLLNFWIGKVFAPVHDALFGTNELGSIDDSLSSKNEFVLKFSSGSEDTIKFDDWMQSQTSAFVFAKVGGPAVISLRRVLIAAIIKHTGCGSACASALSNRKGERAINSRVLNWLKEIWFAAQRIIQDIMKQRQETGQSLTVVCKFLREKAEYLLSTEESPTALEISDILMMLMDEKEPLSVVLSPPRELPVEDTTGKDSLPELFARSLSDVLKFLQCPVANIVPLLRANFRRSAIVSVFRIAGFRAIMFTIQPTEDAPVSGKSLPGLSILPIQPLVLSGILGGLLKKCSLPIQQQSDSANLPSKFPSPKSHQGSKELDSSSNASIPMQGHYTVGLNGLSSQLKQSLVTSFESLFEFITQLASRCTWAKNLNGQLLCLSCWNIRISFKDHLFLNRVGIFKVLRNVLDDARVLMNELDMSSSGLTTVDISEYPSHASVAMTKQACSKLAQLALRIVHSLSSQVAFSMDPRAKAGKTNQLQRLASGPDTLSQSLFDLLYSELFFSLKDLLHSLHWASKSGDFENSASKAGSNVTESNAFVFLKGEDYIYRILRLLYSVSTSRVCQKSISTPKWISLLLLGIGCGGIGTQRRIFRLLRRLLVSMAPDGMDLFVPHFFGNRQELACASEPFADKDMKNLSFDGTISSPANNPFDFAILGARLTAAEKIIELLLYAVAVAYPVSIDGNLAEKSTGKFIKYLLEQDSLYTVSSEALALLRVLQGISSWRRVIDMVLQKIDNACTADHIELLSSTMNAKSLLSLGAQCLLGGYVERNRVGGFVSLTPVALTASNEALSTQVTGYTRGDGLVVGISKGSEGTEVEMVFMERHLKLFDAQSVTGQASSDDVESSARNVQHLCTVTATVPIVAIRVHTSKLIPCGEIPAQAEFMPLANFDGLLSRIESSLRASVEASSSLESVTIGNVLSTGGPVLSTLSNTVSLGQFAYAMHHVPHICRTIYSIFNKPRSTSHESMLFDLLAFSLRDASAGGVCDLETVQQRWTALWDAVVAAAFGCRLAPSAQPASIKVTASGGGSTLNSLGRRSHPSTSNERAAPAERQPGLEREASSGRMLGYGGGSLSEQLAIHRQMAAAAPPRQQVDPAAFAAAVAQMQEMGLPKDWCEVALRRCRNNIEMAINMCFEQSAEMPQLVAEEAMAREAMALRTSQQQQQRERGEREFEEQLLGLRTSELSSTEQSILSRYLPRFLSRSSGRGAGSGGSSTASPAIPQQLLDLGLSPAICARAMQEGGGDGKKIDVLPSRS
jgi:hypothetical protein